jgi:hypothetical protein
VLPQLLPSKVNGALGASLCANAMQTDKTEPDKKQKASGIVFMFFPSFVSVYQRAGRSLCHQRKSISKWLVTHNCAELFDASVKKRPSLGAHIRSEFISH